MTGKKHSTLLHLNVGKKMNKKNRNVVKTRKSKKKHKKKSYNRLKFLRVNDFHRECLLRAKLYLYINISQ